MSQIAGSDPVDPAIRDTRRAQKSARRRAWALPVIAIAAVLVGLGAGWLLFSRDMSVVAMTAAQQDAWAQLEASGDYDAGSIHLVGHKYGADIWMATRGEVHLECLVLTRADAEPTTGCRSDQQDDEDAQLQVNSTYQDDGTEYAMWASIAEDIAGNQVAIVQRMDMSQGWDWHSMYSDVELEIVDILEAAGFRGDTLNIVGYDGETPVWVGAQGQICVMIVQDGSVAQQCGDIATDSDQPLVLTVGDTAYSVSLSSNRGFSLTIERGVGETGTGR
ncbi:hypothetical protein [Microbacterium suwonense]|uniref:hypothetical protein n=1 Tax=Microbacterium suwonense TaxID=683047 RepID=UPI002572EC13|nr:hypothetical protein [Microbacterium suwonense]